MQALRAFVHRHRLVAAVIVLCALALKAAVPAGYMLGQAGKVLTIRICADASGTPQAQQIVVPSSHEGKPAEMASAETCPYAALGFAMLGGADPALLAIVLAFIVALGFTATPSPPVRRALFLRPPLRGPPGFA